MALSRLVQNSPSYLVWRVLFHLFIISVVVILKVKVKVKVSVFIQRTFCSTSHSRRSGMDHTVLPAIITMPAFTS